MGFAPHALAVLAAPRGGWVEVLLHSPLPPGQDRKALSAAAEAAVRDGLARAGGPA
jgi:1-acyl-sn-glycerol-3-phosphate acyltransferase